MLFCHGNDHLGLGQFEFSRNLAALIGVDGIAELGELSCQSSIKARSKKPPSVRSGHREPRADRQLCANSGHEMLSSQLDDV
ncbi:hypothetical protein [Peteryoungia ipomoeae]|uniref:Uncharacterized protein n=1 Tax=Peteryoungia ipomoeae TaxID=1210932 RepID=A0A4V4HLW4_9HYPH|nr:hypothetical protein [Peteryoungia ipomoeae]THV19886.1 hypothetical protein FAA97_20145 [Peteryoungia ipomoeae]